MNPFSPAVLVCDAIAWRVDRVERALERIRAALPAPALERLTLGYRSREDMAVLVLEPGPTAPAGFATVARSEARLGGLRSLDYEAAGIGAPEAAARALRRCTMVTDGNEPGAAVAALRRDLGLDRDRRSAVRVDAPLPVRVELPGGPRPGTARNLVAGGVFVVFPEPLPPIGTRVTLELGLPGDLEPVEVAAEVIHHGRGDGFGARIQVPEDGTERLATAVRRLRALPSADPRRTCPRVPAHFELDLLLGERTVRARTVDLSAGGAFVGTAADPATGTAVDVVLHLSSGEALPIGAEVIRRVEGPGAGLALAFRRIAPADRARLEAVVAALLPPSLRTLVAVADPARRAELAAALGTVRAEVIEAEDGGAALDRMIEEVLGFDLLVIALELPDMSGLELLIRLRRLGSQATMILVGAIDEDTREDLLMAGADEALSDAIGADEVAARAGRLLDGWVLPT